MKKKLLSILLSLAICISILALPFDFGKITASAVYAGTASTYVDGRHHFPNVALGGTRLSALNAAEVTPAYTFQTNCSYVTREMSDIDAPTATYYVDISKSNTVNIPLSFTIIDKAYCDTMNYHLITSSSEYTTDAGNQQFVNDKGVNYSKTHYLTGPAPTATGQSVEILVGLWTDIAQNATFSATTYIHALIKLKIRIVAFGTNTEDNTVTVSNTCIRNYPYVYTTDRTLSVYNVDSGTNANYSNSNDPVTSMGNDYFPIYSTAYAYAYVDASRYSNLNETSIYFSHDLRNLCGNGGWSWGDVTVSSNYADYTLSRQTDYTVENSNYTSNIYNLPFKLNGRVPAAGETAQITITSRCNALGWNSPEQIFYNSAAPIILTVYGIDKTDLKQAIDVQVGENHPTDNYNTYLSALSNAQAVYANKTASQAEIDSATNSLNEAINNIDLLPQNKLELLQSSELTMSNKLLCGDFSRITNLKNEFANEELFFYLPNGDEISEIDTFTTGIRVAVKTGEVVSDYADIVVVGDVTCDGRVDGQDAVVTNTIVKNIAELEPCCVKSADINTDGRVSSYDVNCMVEIGLLLRDATISVTPSYIGADDIVVSTDGDDSADGSYQYPLATISAAKEKAKQLKGTVNEPITVWIKGGTYRLSSKLIFNSSDLENVTYKAMPNETVEISGAQEITGFTETTVNGVRAFVTDYEYNGDTDGLNTLYKGDIRLKRPTWPENGEFNVAGMNGADAFAPRSNYYSFNTAFYANTSDLLSFGNVNDVDVRIMHWWKDELLPINSIDQSSGRVTFKKASAMTINSGDRYLFENVFEALNEPDEWYYDRAQGKMYYIPYADETVEDIVLNIGVTNQLIEIDGCNGINFSGIAFRDTDWRMQSGESQSHPLNETIQYYADFSQACYDIPCTIEVKYSNSVNFESCSFKMLGSSGVRFGEGTADCSVTSSRFKNIGGNAFYIRGINDPNSNGKTHGIEISDCLIETYGRIFNNAVGILLIHAYDCVMDHNEIRDGFYSGISCGWVWGYGYNISNNNKITNNLIYDIGQGWLSDMGGIYTLGMQPDTEISGNVVYNVGCSDDSEGYGGWGIYLDEGSSGIDVTRNLVYNCSSDGFHQHYGKFNYIHNNIFALNGEAQIKLSRVEGHTSFDLNNNILLSDNASMYADCQTNSFTDNSNLYWDLTRGTNVYSDSLSKWDVQNRGFYQNGFFADPMFKDAKSFDFTLQNDSLLDTFGFVKWDYSQAGTLTDFGEYVVGSNSNGVSTTVKNIQNYFNVASGSSSFTVFGADEVSTGEYVYSVNNLEKTREMNSGDAPVATFYVDVNKAENVKVKLDFEIINKDYCDIMNYHYSLDNPKFTTTASNQVFVNTHSVGSHKIDYLTGYIPKKAGDVEEVTVTLWTDMAQDSTYSTSTYIHSGAKIKLRFIGI